MMRSGLASVAFVVVGACSAFSGGNEAGPSDGGADGSTDGADGAANGGDGAADHADGGNGDVDGSADAGPTCPIVLTEAFNAQGALPATWNPQGDMTGSVMVDGLQFVSGSSALHAHVEQGDSGANGGYTELTRQITVTAASTAVLSYSVYMQDWGTATAQVGCILQVDQNAGLKGVRLYRDAAGALDVEMYGLGIIPRLPFNPPLSGLSGWHRVTIVLTGIATGNMSAVFTVRGPDGTSSVATVGESFDMSPTSALSIECGLTSVAFATPAQPLDTWIDDVSVGVCP